LRTLRRSTTRSIGSPVSGSTSLSSSCVSSSFRSIATARTGFSKQRVTLAIPAGLRAALPAKMTSSIAPPRRLFALRSPSTHLIASTTFDLPQPFGPTMPVMGASKRNSVGSAKLLKPLRTNLARRIELDLRVVGAAVPRPVAPTVARELLLTLPPPLRALPRDAEGLA
jgi:hypothetical protein